MASKGDETGGKTAVAKVNVGDDEVWQDIAVGMERKWMDLRYIQEAVV